MPMTVRARVSNDILGGVRVRNERLGKLLTRLGAAGTIRRLGDRWAVPDSRSPSP